MDRVRQAQREKWARKHLTVRVALSNSEVASAFDAAIRRRVPHKDALQIVEQAVDAAMELGGVLSFGEVVRKINDLPGTPAPLHWAQRNPL